MTQIAPHIFRYCNTGCERLRLDPRRACDGVDGCLDVPGLPDQTAAQRAEQDKLQRQPVPYALPDAE